MASVEIAGVRKSFGTNEVLHGVDLNIEDRTFVVLVGPSGCGKTTLLRLIAGLEEISQGEISIAGRVVNDLEPADRDIAMVFQNYALYPHMTVEGNIGFPLKMDGVSKRDIPGLVRNAANSEHRSIAAAAGSDQRKKPGEGQAHQRYPHQESIPSFHFQPAYQMDLGRYNGQTAHHEAQGYRSDWMTN